MNMSSRTRVISPLRRAARVAISPSGRSCAMGGCPTVLSIYNQSRWCFVHDLPTFQPGLALRS